MSGSGQVQNKGESPPPPPSSASINSNITYPNTLNIELPYNIPGTSLDATSFSLLVVGAAAPVFFLVTVHIILRCRNRRKERYNTAVFASEEYNVRDAWEASRRKDRVSSIWLTSKDSANSPELQNIQRGERETLSVIMEHRDSNTSRWGKRYNLEDTIRAFFDSISLQNNSNDTPPVCNRGRATTETSARRDERASSSSNLNNSEINLADTKEDKRNNRVFESLCDIVINNMTPAEVQNGEAHSTASPTHTVQTNNRLLEVQSLNAESSTGEFSEEEVLKDFDAILSIYCDETEFIGEDWKFLQIKI